MGALGLAAASWGVRPAVPQRLTPLLAWPGVALPGARRRVGARAAFSGAEEAVESVETFSKDELQSRTPELPLPTPEQPQGASQGPTDRQKVLCEFVLQAIFNFLSCSAVAWAAASAGGSSLTQTGLIMAAHAVIIPLVIFTGIEVSGAHFNPMVTACFVAVGQLRLRLGLAYVAAQVAGGVVGALAAFRSLPGSLQTLAHAGVAAVPPTSTVQQAFLGEAIASFIFVTILFGTNVHPRGWGKLKPFAIPLAVCMLMWLVGPVSSLCINPSRAFGPALVTGFWQHHWIWWTAPFLGGISAAKLYQSAFMPR